MATIETLVTDFLTNITQCLLFFLNPNHQSLIVSIAHYVIFIAGFYYFFFHTRPGDKFRLFFFGLVLLAAISYFSTNRCILTSVERNLSKEKNYIQSTMDHYFGKEIEGNISSKVILTSGTILLGGILLIDYGFLPKTLNISSNA